VQNHPTHVTHIGSPSTSVECHDDPGCRRHFQISCGKIRQGITLSLTLSLERVQIERLKSPGFSAETHWERTSLVPLESVLATTTSASKWTNTHDSLAHACRYLYLPFWGHFSKAPNSKGPWSWIILVLAQKKNKSDYPRRWDVKQTHQVCTHLKYFLNLLVWTLPLKVILSIIAGMQYSPPPPMWGQSLTKRKSSQAHWWLFTSQSRCLWTLDRSKLFYASRNTW